MNVTLLAGFIVAAALAVVVASAFTARSCRAKVPAKVPAPPPTPLKIVFPTSADRLPEWRYGENQVYYYPVAHEFTDTPDAAKDDSPCLIGRDPTISSNAGRYREPVQLEEELRKRGWFQRKSAYQSRGVTSSNCECLKGGTRISPFTAYEPGIPQVNVAASRITAAQEPMRLLSTRYTTDPSTKFYSYSLPSSNRHYVLETR